MCAAPGTAGHATEETAFTLCFANEEDLRRRFLPKGAADPQLLNTVDSAAKAGNPDAQYDLGCLHALGLLGHGSQPDQALPLWEQAAQRGHPLARQSLRIPLAAIQVPAYCRAREALVPFD